MFSQELRLFASNIDALRDFTILVQPALREALNRDMRASFEDVHRFIVLLLRYSADGTLPIEVEATEEVKKELQEITEVLQERYRDEIAVDPTDGRISSVTDGFVDSCMAVKRAFTKRLHQMRLPYESVVISLISCAESFLSKILHKYFQEYPDSAGVRDKQLSLKDLQSIGTIDDAKAYLISLRIEEVLRGGFTDWVKFLHEYLHLSMGYLKGHEDNLVEVFQRRHLLVHNGGVVNVSYLSKTNATLHPPGGIGKRLYVSLSYLNSAINEFERFFTLIALELWKKLEQEDDNRGVVALELCEEHLKNERWEMAEGLSRFTAEDKRLPELLTVTGKLNYWESLKSQGRFEEIRKDVESFDCSAKDPVFRLAKVALLDDEERFFQLLAEVAKTPALVEDLQEWAIFSKVRGTEQYRYLFPQREVEADDANARQG